jgi:hypothetical protein
MNIAHSLRLLTLVLALGPAVALAERPAHLADGQIHPRPDGRLEVWDAEARQWRDPDAFWLAYAQRRGELTWGRGRDYPPYAQVEEHDTFLVELDSGVCLMEFFHRRWRRANDVQRWDDAFNDYGGCPRVFD